MRKAKKILEFLVPLAVAAVMLLSIHASRIFYSGNILLGSESYYNIRIAESLHEKGIMFRDDFVLSSRQTVANPFHVLLALSSRILSIEISARALPFIFGISSILLFILILDYFSFRKREIIIASILLIISPVFIHTFTTATSFSLLALPDLLCFYFFISGRKIFSFICALFVIQFGMISLSSMLLGLFIYSLLIKKFNKNIVFISALVILSASFHMLTNVPFLSTSLASTDYLNESISEFGGNSSFSPFFLILVLSGIVFKHDSKAVKCSYALLSALLLPGIFINPGFNIMLCFGLAPLASIGFIQTEKKRWELGIIKSSVFILIICGLMFSTIAYSKRLAESKPDYPVVQSLAWFSENSDKNAFIFSHLNNGFWIETIGKSRVLFDPLSRNNKYNRLVYNETLQIYYSRNLKRTKYLLDKYSIRYIFIDKSMKHGLVWEEAEEGLLFLFNNNETFEKRYGISGVEIWEYKKT